MPIVDINNLQHVRHNHPARYVDCRAITGLRRRYRCLSTYVWCQMEEAVRWRVIHCIVEDTKTRNAKTRPGELPRIVEPFVRFALNAALEGRLTRPDAVLNTNILMSALISPVGPSGLLRMNS